MLRTFVILAILLMCNSGYCADTTKKKKQGVNPVTTELETKNSIYSVEPVDLKTDMFPPKYMGNDLSEISHRLSDILTAKKDEFETTDQYNKRISEQRKKPLIGKIGIDDHYVLVLPSKDKSIKHDISGFIDYFPQLITSKYDADKHQLITSIKTNSCLDKDEFIRNASCISAYYGVFEPEYYFAGNAMGATIKVEKISRTAYSLMLNEADYNGSDLAADNIDVPTAIKLKNELAVAIIYKLVDPYIKRGWFSTKPTLSEPTESMTSHTSVVGKPVAFWLFDFKTGQIITKTDVAIK